MRYTLLFFLYLIERMSEFLPLLCEACPSAPQNQSFDGRADSIAAPQGSPQAAPLIGPNPAGVRSVRDRGPGENAWPGRSRSGGATKAP